MTAEPYIHLTTGEIAWFKDIEQAGGHHWQQYTCFEREKLRELGGWSFIELRAGWGFYLNDLLNSQVLNRYSMSNWVYGSETSRLLKRAEFLKAVCEKEGVEWLPKGQSCQHQHLRELCNHADVCSKCYEEVPKSCPVEQPEHRVPTLEEIENCLACRGIRRMLGMMWCPGHHAAMELCAARLNKEQERDSYTKVEIDERLRPLLTMIESTNLANRYMRPIFEDFRRRFLSTPNKPYDGKPDFDVDYPKPRLLEKTREEMKADSAPIPEYGWVKKGFGGGGHPES